MGPDAAARILQQDDLAKGDSLVADHRVDDLLCRAVDAAHHRHAIEQPVAEPQQHFADVAGSNGPDQVIVYFYTKNHVSQVVAYYNGTTPDYDVQEYSGSGQGRGR